MLVSENKMERVLSRYSKTAMFVGLAKKSGDAPNASLNAFERPFARLSISALFAPPPHTVATE